ncbi:unnamed protein product, partial [Cyprideis torosa]
LPALVDTKQCRTNWVPNARNPATSYRRITSNGKMEETSALGTTTDTSLSSFTRLNGKHSNPSSPASRIQRKGSFTTHTSGSERALPMRKAGDGMVPERISPRLSRGARSLNLRRRPCSIFRRMSPTEWP